MRLTINIDDRLGQEIKQMAAAQGVSVSSFVAQQLEKTLWKERKAKAVETVLGLAGGNGVSDDAMQLLEAGRSEDDGRF